MAWPSLTSKTDSSAPQQLTQDNRAGTLDAASACWRCQVQCFIGQRLQTAQNHQQQQHAVADLSRHRFMEAYWDGGLLGDSCKAKTHWHYSTYSSTSHQAAGRARVTRPGLVQMQLLRCTYLNDNALQALLAILHRGCQVEEQEHMTLGVLWQVVYDLWGFTLYDHTLSDALNAYLGS